MKVYDEITQSLWKSRQGGRRSWQKELTDIYTPLPLPIHPSSPLFAPAHLTPTSSSVRQLAIIHPPNAFKPPTPPPGSHSLT